MRDPLNGYHAEKEEQRRIREQMREEELALMELEKARLGAERPVGAKQQKLLGQIKELQR